MTENYSSIYIMKGFPRKLNLGIIFLNFSIDTLFRRMSLSHVIYLGSTQNVSTLLFYLNFKSQWLRTDIISSISLRVLFVIMRGFHAVQKLTAEKAIVLIRPFIYFNSKMLDGFC